VGWCGFKRVEGIDSICLACLHCNTSTMLGPQGVGACADPAVLRALPHLNTLFKLGNGLRHCLEASRLCHTFLLQEDTAGSLVAEDTSKQSRTGKRLPSAR
jgi:hypothetical protein